MLENLKKEVCEVAKKAQLSGLCKHKSGNFSAKDKKTGYIVLTPASIDRDELCPRDMVVVDKNAKIIESLSNLNPTSETLMHLKIYETRSDVVAVSHTHSSFATTFAILNKEIPAIVYEVAVLGLTKARVPVAPYGRPGTTDLSESVVEACKESDSFLMEKHGVVGIDSRNIYEAFLKTAYIEELAELYYKTLMINKQKEPDYFSQEELSSWKYPEMLKVRD